MREIKERENEQIGLVFIQGAGLESRIWEPVVPEMKSPFLLVNFPERGGENGLQKSLTLQEGVSPTFSARHTLSNIRQGFMSLYIR
ncbi:hypothetical protein ACE38V_08290 [Cytobacillus sp. Hz8]|uniref:hypothetical protein n=1 Tax=Cytobacillus sp. Hz8 TaxID=3347168 RepID=UPI0035D6B7D1